MYRRTAIAVFGIAALTMSLPVGGAAGQSLEAQLLGTWILVSHESVRGDGTKSSVYGANPKGIAFFDAGGHFIITAMRSDRVPYAADFPTQGTAEENKATAQGTITYFGTYSISEA